MTRQSQCDKMLMIESWRARVGDTKHGSVAALLNSELFRFGLGLQLSIQPKMIAPYKSDAETIESVQKMQYT